MVEDNLEVARKFVSSPIPELREHQLKTVREDISTLVRAFDLHKTYAPDPERMIWLIGNQAVGSLVTLQCARECRAVVGYAKYVGVWFTLDRSRGAKYNEYKLRDWKQYTLEEWEAYLLQRNDAL